MTEDQLVKKMDSARKDLRDGFSTMREFLDHVSSIFDGDTEWALKGQPPTPTMRMVPYLVRGQGASR